MTINALDLWYRFMLVRSYDSLHTFAPTAPKQKNPLLAWIRYEIENFKLGDSWLLVIYFGWVCNLKCICDWWNWNDYRCYKLSTPKLYTYIVNLYIKFTVLGCITFSTVLLWTKQTMAVHTIIHDFEE